MDSARSYKRDQESTGEMISKIPLNLFNSEETCKVHGAWFQPQVFGRTTILSFLSVFPGKESAGLWIFGPW